MAKVFTVATCKNWRHGEESGSGFTSPDGIDNATAPVGNGKQSSDWAKRMLKGRRALGNATLWY